MSYTHRTPVHQPSATDSPSSLHNPKVQHQYSELLQMGTTDSDGSATYTMPAYAPSSDGSHTTYSTTAPLYHNPNCQCHLQPSQPMQCISPAHQSVQSAESSGSSSAMTASCTKEGWVVKETNEETVVSRCNQPIAWIWMSLSWLLLVVSTLTLTQTGWLVNSSTSESLGLIKYCRKNSVTGELDCAAYNGLGSLKLPSTSWKLTIIFFCVADTLLGLSSLLALATTVLVRTKTRRYISFFTGYVQLFAAILFTTAALFYMVGLDSPEVKDICGQKASIFETGSCHVGWSYLLLTISSSLCFLLPVLSHYIDHTLCAKQGQLQPPQYLA